MTQTEPNRLEPYTGWSIWSCTFFFVDINLKSHAPVYFCKSCSSPGPKFEESSYRGLLQKKVCFEMCPPVGTFWGWLVRFYVQILSYKTYQPAETYFLLQRTPGQKVGGRISKFLPSPFSAWKHAQFSPRVEEAWLLGTSRFTIQ